MKDSTKQRIFWIIIAVMLAAVIFTFSSQNTEQSEGLSDSVAEILQMEQAEQYTRVSNQEIIFGLTLRKLAHIFLYALLGFSLYFAFDGIRARFPLAVGTAFCYGILDEFHQTMSGRIGRWQDTLIDLGGILIGAGLAVLILFLQKKIKAWFDKQKEHHRLEMVLDALSLASVLFYAIYRFLQSTMFQFYYSNRYKMLTIILPIVFGGIRFLYLVLKKCWAAESHKEQSFFILRCILAFCLLIPFVLVGWMHDYKMLIYLPICCMCLYDMVPEKVCRVFFVTIGTCLVAVILCCLSGTVRNIVVHDNGVYASYGIINTTDFASYFTFLLLTAWCSMRTRKWYTSVLFAVASGIITYIVYLYTGSRTALYTGALIVFLVQWDCLGEHVFCREKKLRRIRKCINWLSILAFPVVGALVIFLTARFAAQDTWALELEKLLSGRLKTVLQPFQMYGVKPFGSTIEKMYGFGGTILGKYWSAEYSYLDVGYAMLAIRCGWVITAIVMVLWMWMTAKALKNGKTRIAFALVVLAAHAFSEARILDVNFNIFLIMPFCAFSQEKTVSEKAPERKWQRLFPVLSGIAFFAAALLLLPTALRWLRAYFYLKGWYDGIAAFTSFSFCSGLILVLLGLWKVLSLFQETKEGKILATLVGLLLLLTGGVLSVNATIEQGRAEQADRLQAEEQVIRKMQACATMPVYAAESEELYRRDGVRLPNHFFTLEELNRNRGSFLTADTVEAFEVLPFGGRYTQISNYSGLYTFDTAVMESLSSIGYTWSIFYSGERHCNLDDLAVFNSMKMTDGQLVLTNAARVETKNMETDQMSGTYRVTFSFSGFAASSDGQAILLQVIGEGGDRIICQKTLSAADFNSEGRCDYTMTYQITATPQVTYAISVTEGVTATVNDIAWQRVSITDQDHINLLYASETPRIGAGDYANGVWRVASSGTGIREVVDLDDSPIAGITKGLHFYATVDSPSVSDLAIDRIPLVYGNRYRLSCYAKGSGRLHLQHGSSAWSFVVHDVTNEWTYYSYDFVVGEKDGASPKEPLVSVYFGCLGKTEADFYVCDMFLEDITGQDAGFK